MSTSSDKVKCDHCDLVLTKKNLKAHTKSIHGLEAKILFSSIHSTDMRGIFTLESDRKIPKLSDEGPSLTTPRKTNILSSTPSELLPDKSRSTESMDSVLTKLDALNMKVDKLEKAQGKKNIIINTADLSTLVDKNELLVACRSIDMILSFFPCFTIAQNSSHQGLLCTACETTLNYVSKPVWNLILLNIYRLLFLT